MMMMMMVVKVLLRQSLFPANQHHLPKKSDECISAKPAHTAAISCLMCAADLARFWRPQNAYRYSMRQLSVSITITLLIDSR